LTEFKVNFPKYFSAEEQKSSRPLRALINLSAFKNNIKIVQSLVDSSEIIVVVKADAYGHGLVELAFAAENHDLAVAIPEELQSLREAGVENRVWVLEGFFSSDSIKLSRSVVWVIHSFWQLEFLKDAVIESGFDNVDICIKLDTGMNRLGFCHTKLEQVKEYISNIPQLNIYALMTHFSMSDQANNKQVYSQIEKFDAVILKNNMSAIKQSMANSGGIYHYPESHRHWVRPGIMLYGGKPCAAISSPIATYAVMSFQSAIIALHEVKKDESVGYGGAWTADKDSLIATVAVGYADGYPRHAPNGTPVAVINASGDIEVVGLVGRVSMDMITVDVTSIKNVSIGDQVELWGKYISVDDIAELSGTISYELLTSVSKRVPRVYES
jgi:alanine racemase